MKAGIHKKGNRFSAVCCDCSNYGGTYRADILTNAGVNHYDDQ